LKTLTEISNFHGTDKGTTAFECHGYSEIYAKYFDILRNDPINILEIGVYDGRFPCASIKTWYDYFLNGQIYGIDIDEKALAFQNDRIHINMVNQCQKLQLKDYTDKLNIQFDIIIDDGSHRPVDHQISLGHFFPYLKSNGLYIIEDLHAPWCAESLMIFSNKDLNKLLYIEEDEKNYILNNIQNIDICLNKIVFIRKK
jgi:hypothetical protein